MAKLKIAICSQCQQEKLVYANRICGECGKKRTAEYRKRWKAAGKCPNCARDREPGYATCKACREKAQAYVRKRGMKVGVCHDCKKETDVYSTGRICRPCSSERSRKRRFKNYDLGKCRCGNARIDGKTVCERCWLRRKSYTKQNAARSERFKIANLERLTVHRKKQTLENKTRIFNAYGGCVCACCGETRIEFLSLNHLNGDGAQHRREVKNVYRWIIRNNFPPGFNVLCMNCNFSSGKFGYCPHKQPAVPATV